MRDEAAFPKGEPSNYQSQEGFSRITLQTDAGAEACQPAQRLHPQPRHREYARHGGGK